MDTTKLCSLTEELCSDLSATLSRARLGFNADPAEWMEKTINTDLGPCIGKYSRYYTGLGVNSQEELHQLFKTNFKSVEVQEVYEELVELEKAWNSFTREVDDRFTDPLSITVQEQDFIPDSVTVRDLRNNTLRLRDILSGEDKFLHLILLRHLA